LFSPAAASSEEGPYTGPVAAEAPSVLVDRYEEETLERPHLSLLAERRYGRANRVGLLNLILG
jgi:hypothetical protein